MASSTVTATRSGQSTRTARRLGGRTRKAVLLTHIVAAGTWFGLDVVMAILVVLAATGDTTTQASALTVLAVVTVWPMTTAGLLTLVTGVLLGLGGKYGVVRYWWVAVKLVVTLLLTTLVLVALRPGVNDLADAGRALAAGLPTDVSLGDMAFPPVVSPALLLLAFVLSVFKPWGRVRG